MVVVHRRLRPHILRRLYPPNNVGFEGGRGRPKDELGVDHFFGQRVGRYQTGDAVTRMLDTFVMKSSKDIVLSSPVIGRPRLRRQTLVNLRFKFVKPLGVLHCLGHWKGNSFGICFGLVGIGLSLKNSSFSDSALLLLLQTESHRIDRPSGFAQEG